MDIDLLKTFLEVDRTRHFGRAADNLYLSQSAISARIRLLEEQIGSPVFTRERNDIQLTAIGRKLLKHAESIVTAWNRARQEVTLSDESKRSLVVGGSPGIWDILLQSWLPRMYRELPDISLHAEATPQDYLLRKLLDGTLDLAFTFEGPQIVRLTVTEVCKIPLIMVSSKKDINAETALQKDYILVDWGTSFLTTHARQFKDFPVPRLQLGLGKIALEFLKGNGGSAYLAEPMVNQELNSKILFRVNDAPVIERSMFAVYSDKCNNLDIIDDALSLIK